MIRGISLASLWLACLVLVMGCERGTHVPVTRSAIESRDVAVTLITDIAEAVAPGSPVTSFLPEDASIDCELPRQSQVHYTLFREFEAPKGTSGAALITKMGRQFAQRGFMLHPPYRAGRGLVLSGQTKTEGVVVRGEEDAPTVTITFDTGCGLSETSATSPYS